MTLREVYQEEIEYMKKDIAECESKIEKLQKEIEQHKMDLGYYRLNLEQLEKALDVTDPDKLDREF